MAKILYFCVLVECDHCKGKKHVPGGQREYGELVPCPLCHGQGHVPGVATFEEFAKLMQGIASL